MAQGSSIDTYKLLLIGGSAGSLEAILRLLPNLQIQKMLAIVLVLHRRTGESLLARLLSDKSGWNVNEAEEKESIQAGTIYIAPADYHLLIERDRTFSLDYSEKVNFSRPAIDITFETAAEAYGKSVMALLLSGANHDGTEGLKRIKQAGGYVMIQDPADAQVRYMPQHAMAQVLADEIVTANSVPASIQRLLHG